MSNFKGQAVNPKTMQIEEATWIDHGYEGYTVLFPDGSEYQSDGNEIPSTAEEICEDCGGTGEVNEDEYEHGQIVGRGTIARPCPTCRPRRTRDDEMDDDS